MHNHVLVLAIFHKLHRYKNALTISEDAQRTFRRRTREEHVNGYYINIYTVLTDSSWFNLEFLTEEAREEAKRIRDRLVNEVHDMEELPPNVMDYGSRTGLNSSSPEAQGLLSGEEEMLVPYEGWYKEARGFYANQHYHFRWSIGEVDPSLKALMPELFPPVKV